jgi:uncharacterized membrane protein YqhA
MANLTPENNFSSKLERIFKVKYLALIVAILLMMCGILAIALGVIRFVESIIILVSHAGKPGLHLIESVDTLLFALVILVLAGGIFKLFVGNEHTFKESAIFSKLNSFRDLKVLLWETLLLTLTVLCVLSFFFDPENQNYEQLILPASIVLLALGLKFLKDDKK